MASTMLSIYGLHGRPHISPASTPKHLAILEAGGGALFNPDGPQEPQEDGPELPQQQQHSRFLAALSMALLTLQGTALSLALRYSRAQAGELYLPSASGEPTASSLGLSS
jgi:hypothetical protein